MHIYDHVIIYIFVSFRCHFGSSDVRSQKTNINRVLSVDHGRPSSIKNGLLVLSGACFCVRLLVGRYIRFIMFLRSLTTNFTDEMTAPNVLYDTSLTGYNYSKAVATVQEQVASSAPRYSKTSYVEFQTPELWLAVADVGLAHLLVPSSSLWVR